jgi:hypothetical protein
MENPFGKGFDTTPSEYSVEVAQLIGAVSHDCAQTDITAAEALTK